MCHFKRMHGTLESNRRNHNSNSRQKVSNNSNHAFLKFHPLITLYCTCREYLLLLVQRGYYSQQPHLLIVNGAALLKYHFLKNKSIATWTRSGILRLRRWANMAMNRTFILSFSIVLFSLQRSRSQLANGTKFCKERSTHVLISGSLLHNFRT